MVQRVVNDVSQRRIGTTAQGTDAVEDNDGIVQRVTQNGQHNSNEVVVQLNTKDHEGEEHDQQVVQQGDQSGHTGGHTTDLTEAEAHIDDQQDSSQTQSQQAAHQELEAHGSGQGVGAVRLSGVQLGNGLAQLGVQISLLLSVDALGQGQGHQLGLTAIFLNHLHIGVQHVLGHVLNLIQVGSLGVLVLHTSTALEGDIHLDAEDSQASNAHQHDGGRDDQSALEIAYEIIVFHHLRSPP